MVRQIQVLCPNDKAEVVAKEMRRLDAVHHLAEFPGRETTLMIFRAREKKSKLIMYRLEQLGVGTRFGVIDIINLQMTKPRLAKPAHERREEEAKKQYRMDDRMTIEEIYEFVDSQVHLTFDYLALTSCAAIIAGVGLLTDSSVLVAAAMLVAPLMGPILGLTFGYIVKDRGMIWKGFRNETIGVLLTFLWGVVMGVVVVPFADIPNWTTDQMTQRGTFGALIGGVAVAIPSGAGVALSCTSGGIAPLVGVAISASLLPPIVNSGICLVFGIVANTSWETENRDHMEIAMYSMLLFILNWVLIFVFALIMFRIKRVRGDIKTLFHKEPSSMAGNGTEVVRSTRWSRLPFYGGPAVSQASSIARRRSSLRRHSDAGSYNYDDQHSHYLDLADQEAEPPLLYSLNNNNNNNNNSDLADDQRQPLV